MPIAGLIDHAHARVTVPDIARSRTLCDDVTPLGLCCRP